jgi:hypothetical protein
MERQGFCSEIVTVRFWPKNDVSKIAMAPHNKQCSGRSEIKCQGT